MSDATTGVIIDASTFRPVPRHSFTTRGGTTHRVLGFTQLRGDAQNDIRTLDERMGKCTTLSEQRATIIGALLSFFPAPAADATTDDLDRFAALRAEMNGESLDFLYWAVFSLMNTDFKTDEDGAARPTKSRRKSGSRRNTSR